MPREEMRKPLRILSIEDDPKDTQLIQDLLETEGVVCEVQRIDTEAALVASLERGGIDLILADYSLPSFDGISALKLAMKACPDVPFIFVSGTLGEEVAIEALKIGATDYVLKTSLSRLVPSVWRALREATQKAERKRAEEALRRSEAYLAEAQHLSRTGSFGWKVSSGEIYWSEETYKVFGYDPGAKPALELVFRRMHPDDRDRIQQALDRAYEAKADLDFEHRLLMPDGSVKYVHVLARALQTSPDDLEYVGAVTDVTAAKRTEETLRESEAYLAEAQRLSRTGSWASNPATGEIRYWSEECYRLLGFDPRSGLPGYEMFFQSIHPDDHAKVRKWVETAGREKTEFELDYRIVHPGGEIRDIHTVGHPVFSPSGNLVEFVGTVIDTTETKSAEKKLRRSEESLLEAEKLSHTGSWRHDVASGTVTVSPEVYRMHGIKPDEDALNTEFFFSKFHPEDRKRVVDLFERAEAEKTELQLDYRIVLSDGTIKHLHTIGRPVLNESGELVEFVGTAIDVTERKQGEQATRLLAAIVESSHDAIVSKTLDGVITSWNKGAERLFGYAAEEAIGQNILMIVPPDRRDEERAIIEQLTRGERVDHFETVRVRKDGSLLDVALTISPMRDAAGRIVGASKLAQDITERKRAEQSLRRSEGYLAEAQRLSHTGSWAWAPATGQMRYCSEELYRLMGFDPQGGQPRFETFFKRIHPDDQPRIAKTLDRATRERADFEMEDRIILPGGEIRDVHVVGHPVLSPSGNLVEFVGTVMDVTERNQAEALRDGESRILELIARDARLEEVLEKLARVVEARFPGMLCSTLLLDEDGQHVRHVAAPSLPQPYTNAINGLSIGPKAGSCGTAMYRRLPVVVTDILRDPLWEAYRDLVKPHGLRACWSTPILAHSGKALGSFAMYYREPRSPSLAETHALEMATHLAGIAIERKLAREQRERLRQAQAELAHINRVTTMGELTASLAHEIRQPISAAITDANTCLRWLGRDEPEVAEAREAVSRIVKDVTRAADIISRISVLFKKEAPQREFVDVNELIREMIVLLRSEANRYSISVRTELAGGLPKVMADRVQLQQVFMNLMLNGIEAMKGTTGGGELTIKSRAGDGQLLISVCDTGMGLPLEQAEQIFKAFFTTKDNGTGMGLPISRSIIESHGGRLWATGAPGSGATFQFTLPATAAAHA
jgi:PAS domain S-box-containing protein